jgi:hypothetical protein
MMGTAVGAFVCPIAKGQGAIPHPAIGIASADFKLTRHVALTNERLRSLLVRLQRGIGQMMEMNRSTWFTASLSLTLLVLAQPGTYGQSPTAAEGEAAVAAAAKQAQKDEYEVMKRGGEVIWPRDKNGSPNYTHGEPYYDTVALKCDDRYPAVRLRNVELTDADLVALRDPLGRINPRELNIRFTAVKGVTPEGKSVWDCLELQALKRLNISSTLVDADGLSLNLDNFQNLTILSLEYDTLVFEEFLHFIECTGRRGLHLHLSHVQMRDRGGKRLEADTWFERLVCCISKKNQDCKGAIVGLDVSYTHLTDRGLTFLQDADGASKLRGLSDLSFAGNEDVTNAGLSFLPYLSNSISKINLSDTALNDDGLFENLDCFTGLTSLSLANTTITDRGLEQILSDNVESLTELNLAGTPTMSGGKNCQTVGRMQKLRFLGLEGTGINDDGLREIWESEFTAASKLPSVQADELQRESIKFVVLGEGPRSNLLRYHRGALNKLYLNNTQVTARGLFDVDPNTGIESAARFPHVTEFTLSGTKITDGVLNHWKAVRARTLPQHVDAPSKTQRGGCSDSAAQESAGGSQY